MDEKIWMGIFLIFFSGMFFSTVVISFLEIFVDEFDTIHSERLEDEYESPETFYEKIIVDAAFGGIVLVFGIRMIKRSEVNNPII